MIDEIYTYPDLPTKQRAFMIMVQSFCALWERAEFNTAHLVLDDNNLSDDDIVFCKMLTQDVFNEVASAQDMDTFKHVSKEELRATIAFLDVILAIPKEHRGVWAYEDNDDDNA